MTNARIQTPRSTTYVRQHRLACLVFCLANALAFADEPPPLGWTFSALTGMARTPDFEGSRTSRNVVLIGAEASYRSEHYGTVNLGRGGISWAMLDAPTLQAGLAIMADPGRDVEDHGNAFRALTQQPGAARLQGLGKIGQTAFVGPFVTGKYGMLTASATAMQAVASHHGALLQLTVAMPLPLSEAVTLSPSMGTTWADHKYMQAYFGVSPSQSAASTYRRFDAGAGLKSLDMGLELNWRLDKRWALNSAAGLRRLQGDAASSPITETRNQSSFMIGANYAF
jgi:outer membrane scaffolding protein for murein synthesis (MipA/OmpV family)